MSEEFIYKIKKRGRDFGSFSVNEIFDLLKQRQLNVMCKVQVEGKWIGLDDFIKLQKSEDRNNSDLKSDPKRELSQAIKMPSEKIKNDFSSEIENKHFRVPPVIKSRTELTIVRNGEKFGPYHLEEIQEYINQGLVSLRDSVYISGFSKKLIIDEIPEVKAGIKSNVLAQQNTLGINSESNPPHFDNEDSGNNNNDKVKPTDGDMSLLNRQASPSLLSAEPLHRISEDPSYVNTKTGLFQLIKKTFLGLLVLITSILGYPLVFFLGISFELAKIIGSLLLILLVIFIWWGLLEWLGVIEGSVR